MPSPELRLAHTKHVLPNGLEVVLHQDRSDPIVAVYVYYHVGSSREEEGKSGFAHLFEHMLFQGSEHVGVNDHFRLIQEAGGTLNGSTNQDRTNYFEVLPANQLELALWLESDRMGFLLPAMTQEKLDTQRDVVRNERRQSYENRPYGLVHETLLAALYPAGHPYSWPTIGSMADIAAASLEDVGAFFRRWYGPNNATLVIGGDFDPEEAMMLVRRYFGPVSRGRAVETPAPEPARLEETKRVVIEDKARVPQLTLCWPGVEAGHAHEPKLDLLTDVLSANRSSLFDHALMVESEDASHVTIASHAGERAGYLVLNLRPTPGVTLERLERRVDELLASFVENEIDEARVERLKTRRIGHLVRSLETVSARCARLGHDNCFTKRPDRVQGELDALAATSAGELRDLARSYLHLRPRVVLSVVPEGRRELAAPDPVRRRGSVRELDRAALPAPGPERPFRSPRIWHARLPNGVRLAGTPFTKVPLTRLSLAVPAGRLRETPDVLGLAELTARMLEEGTRSLSGYELVDRLDGLGAQLAIEANDDEIVLRASVLDEHLAELADLLADVVLEPRFAPADFERVRRRQLVDLDARADRPVAIAEDAFRRRIHGPIAPGKIAGAPVLGTRATLESLRVEQVQRFWREHARPSWARIALAGHGGPDDVAALLARLAGDWGSTGTGPVSSNGSAGSEAIEGLTIHLVDRPGAEQSELRVGHQGIARTDPDWFGAYALNHLFGGAFTSRINLNLREEKGYTYAARSDFRGGLTPGPFVVSTAVETEVTGPALREILAELRGLRSGFRPEEVAFGRRSLSQSLAGALESSSARLQLVEAVEKYGWPDDTPARRLAWLSSMDAPELDALVQRLVRPEDLVVVVVGDRARVAPELAELGPLVDVAADGETIQVQRPA